jgi:hypothetical protein
LVQIDARLHLTYTRRTSYTSVITNTAALVKAHGSVLSDGQGPIPSHATPERKAVCRNEQAS